MFCGHHLWVTCYSDQSSLKNWVILRNGISFFHDKNAFFHIQTLKNQDPVNRQQWVDSSNIVFTASCSNPNGWLEDVNKKMFWWKGNGSKIALYVPVCCFICRIPTWFDRYHISSGVEPFTRTTMLALETCWVQVGAPKRLTAPLVVHRSTWTETLAQW